MRASLSVLTELVRSLKLLLDPSALVRGIPHHFQHRHLANFVVDGRRVVYEQHEERGKRSQLDVQLDTSFSGDQVLPEHVRSHGTLLNVCHIRHNKFIWNHIHFRDGAGDGGQKRRRDSDRVVRDRNKKSDGDSSGGNMMKHDKIMTE